MKTKRLVTALPLLVLLGACGQQSVEVPTRSLERSGVTAFVCLGAPGETTSALPPEACANSTAESTKDFSNGPHLYALITQLTRGELAVVDITAGAVVDNDASIPGANFLPVGAQPADLVTSPGSTAAFVASADIGHSGIYALPASGLRACAGCTTPELSSWPACSLPVAPGSMLMLADPADANGDLRATCDSAHAPAAEPGPRGEIGAEGGGRQKLLVTLPDLGAVAVIDAQALLDREPGSFEACDVERFVPLGATVPPITPAVPGPPSLACVEPFRRAPASGTFTSRPSGMAHAAGHLYIGDLEAPLIHDIALPTPCEPVEGPPLLPTSFDDPGRVVKTSRVAVTQALTSSLKRFVYAIDVDDASMMVFDVSPGATGPRTPLIRQNPEYNPFVARDRIKFSAPPRDILMVERDAPISNPITGVAPTGVLCNPDPSASIDPSSASFDLGTLYRTNTNSYESGAGPTKLRGTFAFVALMTGQLAVIDIDDFDAPCRSPFIQATAYGCATDSAAASLTSGEVSCNIVQPNTPRSASYLITSANAGNHEPGVQGFPTLVNQKDGSVLGVGGQRPQMLATLPSVLPQVGNLSGVERAADTFALVVGGTRIPISPSGAIVVDGDTKQSLAMTHEDPRAQVIDQSWSVTFEGPLPGFSSRLAQLDLASARTPGLYDASGRFCEQGVQSEGSLRDQLTAAGLSPAEVDARAVAEADTVEIASAIPAENDPHWSTVGGVCSYQQCNSTFGTAEVPTAGRSLRIVEAYNDHVTTTPREGTGATNELLSCCFPSFVSFKVRPASQWVVTGGASGFLHHVIADPATGVCRNSCDSALSRLNGRIIESPAGAVVSEGDPTAFINPMFHFAIASGTDPTQRDFQFRFTTQSSFNVVSIPVANADTPTSVNPQSLALVPTTGEIAVCDGSLQGLVLVSPASLAVTTQIF